MYSYFVTMSLKATLITTTVTVGNSRLVVTQSDEQVAERQRTSEKFLIIFHFSLIASTTGLRGLLRWRLKTPEKDEWDDRHSLGPWAIVGEAGEAWYHRDCNPAGFLEIWKGPSVSRFSLRSPDIYQSCWLIYHFSTINIKRSCHYEFVSFISFLISLFISIQSLYLK